MFDLWSPEHSVLREKVVEHIFLAELSRSLLLDLGVPFEVLRAEFDANGYDVAIEAAGLLRHVQLKATKTAGARAHVDVQVALAGKPGGCVVWIFVDPKTLELGPFFWFGNEDGRSLPPLGDRKVRHSKGDATGAKGIREGLRRLPKGVFTRFDTMHDLAMAMFPPLDHRLVLDRHLARHGEISRIAQMARGLRWEGSAPLAYMIDGYKLATEIGIDDAFAFADRMRAEAERTGRWSGTPLELWLALFMEHRRDRWQSQGAIGLPLPLEPLPLLDELCEALAKALS